MPTKHGRFTVPDFDINGLPFCLGLSPWALDEFVHELSKVKPGYFALPATATICDGDLYWGGGCWTNTARHGKPVSDEMYAYIRPINSDPKLYQDMVAYAKSGVSTGPKDKTVDPLEVRLEKARQEVARLENELRKENDSIKVGDWVVVEHPDAHGNLVKGDTHLVARMDHSPGNFFLQGDNRVWLKSRFRKATPIEIAAELERRSVVEITVEGKVYKAEYHGEHVKFGCANIDKTILKAALEATRWTHGSEGNRNITAVQIGKGLFTADQIGKMAAKLGIV